MNDNSSLICEITVFSNFDKKKIMLSIQDMTCVMLGKLKIYQMLPRAVIILSSLMYIIVIAFLVQNRMVSLKNYESYDCPFEY